MKRQKYYCMILLFFLGFPVINAIAQTTIQVNHSDYFTETIVSPNSLECDITGFPSDDPRVQLKWGERTLISNTPVSVRKLNETTFLYTTLLEYEVSSNIFTIYTYKDVYPNSYEAKETPIEWCYLRTATDWGITQSQINRYHLTAYYREMIQGNLVPVGFKGNLNFNFALGEEQVPSFVEFTDYDVSLGTLNFESRLKSAVISTSEIVPIGAYNEFYTQGTYISLGSIDLTNFGSLSGVNQGQIDVAGEIRALDLYLDGTAEPTMETPYDCVQLRFPFTKGEDLVLEHMTAYISNEPDVYLNKQTITGRVIQYPDSLDIDTQQNIFSDMGVVNKPVPQKIARDRYISAVVQNYNFHNTYRLQFEVQSTMEIKSISGTVIELTNEPLLNIGDRYIDLAFKGVVGADVVVGQAQTDIWDTILGFFQNIFSTIGGIVGFIAVTILIVVGLYLLIKLGIPAITGKASKKAKQMKQARALED